MFIYKKSVTPRSNHPLVAATSRSVIQQFPSVYWFEAYFTPLNK